MRKEYAIGERVLAAVNGTGLGQRGTVVGVLDGALSRYMWNGEARYMVRFDGDHGHSGPCVVFRAEGEREAASPATGTAA